MTPYLIKEHVSPKQGTKPDDFIWGELLYIEAVKPINMADFMSHDTTWSVQDNHIVVETVEFLPLGRRGVKVVNYQPELNF